MRIGIMSGHGRQDEGVETLISKARDLEARGFPSLWFGNIFAIDAMTVIALIGRETTSIELGTAVVPTFPRHPTVMAQQALTAQSTCGGRFTLGIGLSHQIVIESLFGCRSGRASHMRTSKCSAPCCAGARRLRRRGIPRPRRDPGPRHAARAPRDRGARPEDARTAGERTDGTSCG